MVFITIIKEKIKGSLRKHGFLNTFKKFLWELGILELKFLLKILRIKVYSTIKYPLTGIEINVRFNDFFWRKLAKGSWEFNCIRYLSKIVRNGQTILDVGAWNGPYTLLLSKLVGDGGKVIAFEPDSSAYTFLLENIKINNLKNTIAERIGLSNFTGKSKLVIYRNVFGVRSQSISSLSLRNNEVKSKYEIIKITTIDKYCEENNIHPDGLIIDVEGAEGLVIEGARSIIKKFSPWILLEFHGNLMSKEQQISNLQQILDVSKKVAIINDNLRFYNAKLAKDIPINRNINLFLQNKF